MQAVPRTITTYSPFAPCRGERRNYLASTKYPTSVPRRTQISPGVWSDGNDRVFSAAYPPVQLFLARARSALKQPVAPSEIIFTLAALEVFYKPGDSAHWLFWSDEKKNQTAEVVTRIALHQPPLIRSPVAWNGTNEYLSILANHHGSTYRHVYESQPWYEKLVPQKSSVAPKVLNLRKRKPNPGAFREPSRSPGPEEEDPVEEPQEPPRKRVKPKPAASLEPSPLGHKGPSDMANSSTTNKTHMPTSASSLGSNSHENMSQHPEPPPGSPPTDTVAQTKPSAKPRKTAPSQAISDSSRASSVSPPDLAAVTTNTHLRNRSTSHASSQTVVASSNGRRSSSVLSASTAVEGQGTGKGKQPARDRGDQDGKEISDTQSDEEGMVTRGRASRVRVDISKASPEVESDRVKGGKQALNRARYGAQKAKRKL